MAQWIVRADYDPESKSWYVFDSDVPGLSTGADTLEGLAEKLPGMITELLELNEDLFVDKSRLRGPHSFRLTAHHEAFHSIGGLMGKGFTRQVKAILGDYGCTLVRQGKGDHELWQSPLSGTRFVVDGNIPSRHLANAVLKQAGIKHKID